MSSTKKIVISSISALVLEYIFWVIHFKTYGKFLYESLFLSCSGHDCPNDGFSVCLSDSPRICRFAFDKILLIVILYAVLWLLSYFLVSKVKKEMNKRLRLLLSILLALVEEFLLVSYLVQDVGSPWTEQVNGAWSWFYTVCIDVSPRGLLMLQLKCVTSPMKITTLVVVFILFSIVNWFIIKMISRKGK